jgi:hypothetical protein
MCCCERRYFGRPVVLKGVSHLRYVHSALATATMTAVAAVAWGAGGARGRAEVNARSKVGRSFSRLVVVLVCVPGCKRGSPSADSRLVAGLSLMSWMGGGARSRRLCCWPSGCFAAASVPWYFFFSVPVVSLRSSCNCSCFARFRLARSFPEELEGSLIWGFQTPVRILSLFDSLSVWSYLFIH